MRWLITVGAVFAALFGVAVFVGRSVPVEHSVTVTGVFPVGVETLWTAATDYRGYPLWRSGIDEVERLPDMDGAVAWEERGSAGQITMMIEESSPPHRFVARVVDEEDFGGTWTFVMEEVEAGSRLSLTEDGEVYNPFFRFMSHYVLGYEGALETFMEELAEYLADFRPPSRPAASPPRPGQLALRPFRSTSVRALAVGPLAVGAVRAVPQIP